MARFYINPKKRQTISKCINGHKYRNISYNSFVELCVKEIWSSNKTCYLCYNKINEFKDNYICKKCGYIFCALCITIHFQNSNHNNKIKYINYNSICQIHNKEYKLFCKTCNSNLCNKCQNIHKGHSIKSYKNLLKFLKTKINNIKTTVEENRRKINYVKNTINIWDQDGYLRKQYLIFLYEINEYYLNDFNFEFFNFYHFKNFKYFYEFVTDQIKSIHSVEISGENIKFRRFNDDNIFYVVNNFQNKKYLFFNDNDNFIFYDKNLLFIFGFISRFCCLKLFEIQNYCLRFILLKNFGENDIPLCRPRKKSYEYFFVFDNNIMIFQYDTNNKTLILKDQFENSLNPIIDILDLKNGDIIIANINGIRIIKEKKIIKSFYGYYDNLNHINDIMFISAKNNTITFFDNIKYQIIKKVSFSLNIKESNIIINDKFIIIITESNEFTYIIDIKYLEIIQKIENEKNFKDFHIIAYNNDIYMASNKEIKKYNINKNGKLDKSVKYYINFNLVQYKVEKNHLFSIGSDYISEIDFLL